MSLRWWDQFQPIAPFEKKLFADFATQPGGAHVDYTVQNPATVGQELQLAFQSKQLPDVYTLAGVGLPTPVLKDAGWFQPITLDDAHRKMLPAGALIEGANVFDGKVYSFPIQSSRAYDALVWFNTDLLKKANLDPQQLPVSYDDIRATARAIQKTGDASGWVAPLKLTDRLASQITQMALAAGSPASLSGISFKTGEYVYDSDEFVNAIEFWAAMKQDGSMFPSSTSLDARTARARWSTGVAGMWMDGSYNVGVLKQSFAAFLPKVAVGSIPVASSDASVSISAASNNPGSSFWIAASCQHPDVASRLISKFATDDVQQGIAEAMDAPPLNSAAVQKANVEPIYRTAIGFFGKQVFLGPDPVIRNPDVAKANAKLKPVTPDLGEVVAGAVTGDIADWKGALRTLTAAYESAREAAIKAAGVKLTPADWAFPDWKPGKDYITKPIKG
ncbi:MAG: ABC transporter substrate-binding protein [Nakamurella sp.]